MNKNKSNKLFNKNNFLNWIIGGFIGLIITEIAKPFSVYLFSSFLNFGGNLITHISNSTYQEISNGYAEQTAYSVLCMVYCICIIGSMYLFLYEMHSFQDRTKKISELNIKPITDDKHKPEPNKEIQMHPSDSTYIKASIRKIYRKLELLNKASFILSLVYIFIFLAFFILTVGRTTFIINRITSMTNNIEIVSPYISDQKYKELKSSFHSIENKEDYIQLMDTLNSIASKNSLKLK